MDHQHPEQDVIAAERRALEAWAAGDPAGYFDSMAEEATYFDTMGATHRVDGAAAVRAYAARTFAGQVPPHRFTLVDPKAQVCGDVAIVTLRYEPRSLEDEPLTPSIATLVYRREAGRWRKVHAHWSVVPSP